MTKFALAFDILARDKASRELQNVGSAASKSGGKIKGMAKTATKAFAGLFIADQAKQFFSTAVSGAREAIAIDNQTKAAIKSTGAVAGVTFESVEQLASKLQKTQVISDEVTQAGANLILTFTNIKNAAGEGNDVFDQTVTLANDMSVALKTDVKSAALQLGKALNDPMKGLSALTRSGVSFTEQQKEQVEAMVEAGDTLGAQKVILAEVEKQFGGSAAAQADAGKKLSLAWADFQEVIGRGVIPVLDKGLGYLTKVAEWATENPQKIKIIAGVIGTVLVTAFAKWAVSAASAAAATIAATAPILAVGAAIATVAAGLVYAYNNWDDFREVVDKVAAFLKDTVWPGIQEGVRIIKDNLIPAVADLAAWFADRLSPIVEKNVDIFVNDVIPVLKTVAGFIVDKVIPAIGDFIGFMVDSATAAADMARTIGEKVGAIVEFFTGLAEDIGGIAESLWTPLSDGFRTAINAILEAWNSLDLGIHIEIPKWVPKLGGKGFHIPDVFPDVATLHAGGTVTANGFTPLRSDEVLAKLQLGEKVYPAGSQPDGTRAGTVNIYANEFNLDDAWRFAETRLASGLTGRGDR